MENKDQVRIEWRRKGSSEIHISENSFPIEEAERLVQIANRHFTKAQHSIERAEPEPMVREQLPEGLLKAKPKVKPMTDEEFDELCAGVKADYEGDFGEIDGDSAYDIADGLLSTDRRLEKYVAKRMDLSNEGKSQIMTEFLAGCIHG